MKAVQFIGREFAGSHAGVTVKYDPRTDIGAELFLTGQFESNELALCRRFIPRDAVVFDIGANIGLLAISFAQFATEGVVFSFEPSPETFQVLLQNLANVSNAIPLNIACSDQIGLLEFFLASDNAYSGLKDTLRKPIKARRRVACQTVDSICSFLSLRRLDFVKIDVEGLEENVLLGMRQTIDKYRPVIFCEIYKGVASNSCPERTIDLLVKNGYRPYVMVDGDLATYTHHEDSLYNYLFLPEGVDGETTPHVSGVEHPRS